MNNYLSRIFNIILKIIYLHQNIIIEEYLDYNHISHPKSKL